MFEIKQFKIYSSYSSDSKLITICKNKQDAQKMIKVLEELSFFKKEYHISESSDYIKKNEVEKILNLK